MFRLIDLHSGLLPSWQQNIKRLLDIVISVCAAIILLSPLIIYTAIRVKSYLQKALFYLQERIGYKGKPFIMYQIQKHDADAEKNGPAIKL